MPVIIDGDNLLHMARGALEAERANRGWLCELLSAWAGRVGEGVTIVFDGVRPDSPGDGPITQHPLITRYSGERTADEVIIEALDGSTSPRKLMVVSSDREIRAAARRRRAHPVDSEAFIRRVAGDLRRRDQSERSEPREKFHGLDGQNVEYWLKEFGLEDHR